MLGKTKNDITIKIFIPEEASHGELVLACEKAVTYMFINSKKPFKDYREKYDMLVAHEPVDVTVNRTVWKENLIAFKVIDKDGSESFLVDATSDDIGGKIGACTGSMDKKFHIGRGKPVDSIKVQKPCVQFLKKLLEDTGYTEELVRFGLLSTSTNNDAPELETEQRPEESGEIEDFKTVVGEVIKKIVIPMEVSNEDRKLGWLPLPEYLYYLDVDDRDKYIGQLHSLVNTLSDYLKIVTDLSKQLEGQEDPYETSVRNIQELFQCNREQAEKILQAADAMETNGDEEQQAAPKQDAEDEPLLVQTQRKPEELVLVNAEKYYNVLIGNANINQDDIPEKLKTLADVQAQVPFSTISDLLRDANVRYVSGPDKGKPVKFAAPKARK